MEGHTDAAQTVQWYYLGQINETLQCYYKNQMHSVESLVKIVDLLQLNGFSDAYVLWLTVPDGCSTNLFL